jgi:very-short-patch-repair endonuclease
MKTHPNAWLNFLRSKGIPRPESEFKFHPKRKWRIDYAWPDVKLAVEIEGGVWSKGRHIRGSGFIGDIEKYNALTMAGWSLLRFIPEQLGNGEAISILTEFFFPGRIK